VSINDSARFIKHTFEECQAISAPEKEEQEGKKCPFRVEQMAFS